MRRRAKIRFNYVGVGVVVALIGVVIYGVYFFLLSLIPAFPHRFSILVAANPAYIYSFDPVTNESITVTFPVDMHVVGSNGYGEYAVSSLWNVAAIDGRGEQTVMTSLSYELGVPISSYLLPVDGRAWSSEQSINELFSLVGVLRFFLGQFSHRTNVSWQDVVIMYAHKAQLESVDQREIYLSAGNGLRSVQANDGVTMNVFDRHQFDEMTSVVFEDRSIRAEGLRLAVFNTTGVPFIGSRAGRLLSRLGATVVAVSNGDPIEEPCALYTPSAYLESKTTKRIAELFSCRIYSNDETDQADIEVYIGRE